MVAGLSFSMTVCAGDGGVEISPFGGIASTTLAVSFYPSTYISDSSDSTRGSSNGRDQKIVAARNDAAAFVASDGNIRGVGLEAALEALRLLAETDTSSDMQLARAILVYRSR